MNRWEVFYNEKYPEFGGNTYIEKSVTIVTDFSEEEKAKDTAIKVIRASNRRQLIEITGINKI